MAPGRGVREDRGFDAGHAVTLPDKRDKVAARSRPDEQHTVVGVDEPRQYFFFPAHQPRCNRLVAGADVFPRMLDADPQFADSQGAGRKMIEYAVRTRKEPSHAKERDGHKPQPALP